MVSYWLRQTFILGNVLPKELDFVEGWGHFNKIARPIVAGLLILAPICRIAVVYRNLFWLLIIGRILTPVDIVINRHAVRMG